MTMHKPYPQRNRKRSSGFTLIELLIVVGIISILIAVLAIAIMPWLGRADERRMRSVLQQLGGALSGSSHVPDARQFKRDAGKMSNRVSADEHIQSSQMLLFYLAPTREVWDGSRLYADRNYEPLLTPEEFREFTRESGGGLPYLVDAWENPIWFRYDATQQAVFLYSRGKDGVPGNDDDLIYDGRNNSVVMRSELR